MRCSRIKVMYEPGISEPQTAQMDASSLQLVVPGPIQATYTPDQQAWLWDLSRLVKTVRERQS